jgi:hypothetical protein
MRVNLPILWYRYPASYMIEIGNIMLASSGPGHVFAKQKKSNKCLGKHDWRLEALDKTRDTLDTLCKDLATMLSNFPGIRHLGRIWCLEVQLFYLYWLDGFPYDRSKNMQETCYTDASSTSLGWEQKENFWVPPTRIERVLLALQVLRLEIR